MTTTLRLALAGLLAATVCATTTATATGTADAGAAPSRSEAQAQDAVGAKRAGRFLDRYLRHADRGEWRWVRQHSNRTMKESLPTLRANADHGRYRRAGRCVGYDESDVRTCGYTLAGSLMGEIDVRRRDDGSMVAVRHVLYS